MILDECDRSPIEYHYHLQKSKHTYDNVVEPLDKLIFHLHKTMDWSKENSRERYLLKKLEDLKTEVMDLFEHELCEDDLR